MQPMFVMMVVVIVVMVVMVMVMRVAMAVTMPIVVVGVMPPGFHFAVTASANRPIIPRPLRVTGT